MGTEWYEILAWIWLGTGITLMILELVLPGLVSVFFGAAAVGISVLLFSGYRLALSYQILAWILLSSILILLLRKQVAKIFPAQEYKKYEGSDGSLRGHWVEVTGDVHPDNSRGRVRYQGSTWIARSKNGTIPAGADAYIVDRQNLTLYITTRKPSDSEVNPSPIDQSDL